MADFLSKFHGGDIKFVKDYLIRVANPFFCLSYMYIIRVASSAQPRHLFCAGTLAVNEKIILGNKFNV